MPTDLNRRFLLVFALLAAASLGLASLFVPYQMDDAYIAYRYAANFAAGRGIVFNPNGPWVEGFSSPAWFLMLSALSGLVGRENLPAAGLTLGLASFLVMSWVLGMSLFRNRSAAGGRAQDGDWRPLAAGALIFSAPAVSHYAATGMETILFFAVVLAYAAAIAGRLPYVWGVVAGVAAPWVRPEGMWFPVMGLFFIAGSGRWRTLWERRSLRLLLAPVGGTAALIALRMALFREWVPNTYFAKEPDLMLGVRYVADRLATPGGEALILLAVAALWAGAEARGYVLGAASWLVAIVLEGGDWMPAGRMFLPAAGLFSLAAAELFGPPIVARGRLEPGRRRLLLGAAAVGMIVVVGANLAEVRWHVQKIRVTRRTLGREWQFLERWLTLSGARSIGLVDIGEIGFSTDLEVLDFGGLTDPVISHAPGGHLSKRFERSYLFEQRRPDILIIKLLSPPPEGKEGSAGAWLMTWPVERWLLEDPRFGEYYRILFTLEPPRGRKPYWYAPVVIGRHDFQPSPESLRFAREAAAEYLESHGTHLRP